MRRLPRRLGSPETRDFQDETDTRPRRSKTRLETETSSLHLSVSSLISVMLLRELVIDLLNFMIYVDIQISIGLIC